MERTSIGRYAVPAVLIVGASMTLLFVIAHFDVQSWFADEPPPVVRSIPRPEPARPVVVAPPTSVQPPEPMIPDRQVQRDLQVLNTLMKTCVYWSGQPQDRRAGNLRQLACNRASHFAASHGLPPPRMPGAGPAPQVPAQQRASRTVAVNECKSFRVGSIAYRRCRADEGRRLQSICKNARDIVLAAGRRPTAADRQHAEAVCLVAERYQIVR